LFVLFLMMLISFFVMKHGLALLHKLSKSQEG
jgi:hypothetical protein